MKIDELRKIIYEEVQKAIRVELREMLTEMQLPVSTPKPTIIRTQPVHNTKQDNDNLFSIGDILQETVDNMTREEYHNFIGDTVIQSSDDTTVLTESSSDGFGELPSFVRNAKAILDASAAKDRERHAV